MSITKRVFKNSVWLLLANVVVRMLGAFVVVLLARGFGVEVFGQYSFALSFVGFFTLFTGFGFGSLMIRDVSKDKSLTAKYINNILGIKIVFGIISLIILYIISLFIGKSPTLLIAMYIFGIQLVVSSFSDILRSVFHAYEVMEFDSISRIIEKTIWAVLLLLLIFNKLSLINVALATLLSAILGLIITYWLVRAKISKIKIEYDKKFWKKIIITATPFAITGLFALINFRIDQVMLYFLTNDLTVGLYSAAYKIIDILSVVPTLLLASLYPVFSVLYHKNKSLFNKTFDISLRYAIVLAFPIVIGIYSLANQVIMLAYGTEYLSSVSVLKILIFISLISFINTPLFVVLNAIGKQKITMINAGCTALVNVIMNFILIPRYGIHGAAFATIISELTFLTLSAYQLRKVNIKLDLFSKLLKPLIASIVMGVFIYYFMQLNIFIIIPVAAAIYFIALFALKEFSKEDIATFKKLLVKKTK
jgi:O-antigen/teichoic acid export membrane protein